MYKAIKSNKKEKSSKMDECCEMTFHALQKWYTSEFEKLGWMILAQNRGMKDKIESYKMCLKHLHKSLEMKIKDVHDIDTKHDLELMKHNIEILTKHVNKDFA